MVKMAILCYVFLSHTQKNPDREMVMPNQRSHEWDSLSLAFVPQLC